MVRNYRLSNHGVITPFFRKKKHILIVSILVSLSIAYYFCLPDKLFKVPTATVVESSSGQLLGALIAEDGQWRFPVVDSVPHKFEVSILNFEDAHFYRHPGFNPVSMAKAIRSNWRAGETVRGGSTLSQQLIRMSRHQQQRTYWEKIKELVLATRLELRFSKKEILKSYASHAPFGGNVVGLEMATWRYFGLQPHQLSWAEAATLAVLPNAPSLIYPGKNQEKLLEKRNRLLHKLHKNHYLDSLTYQLSLLEKLPNKPFNVPNKVPHLLQFLAKGNRGERITTTVDPYLQTTVNAIVNNHHKVLRQNQVHNAAVLVMDVNSRKVLSYVGNTTAGADHEENVDMVHANRSTGSVIKPLLYAAMIDAGELLPGMLVPDVPTHIAGYTPENFDRSYSGAVRADRALARSLNIPSVRLLQSYGLQKFRDQLDFFKLKGLNRPADHYGLTLILGGAESNLWDLCKTYASLASTINHFNKTSSEYYIDEFVEPVLRMGFDADFGKKSTEKTLFDAASIYLTFEAMKDLNRPEGSESWEFYDSSKKIAWKTGTSFGNKDAWAIGVTKDHVVGVWVGNADGEGRPNMMGLNTAAPILFDVFDVLPTSSWFQAPEDEFTTIDVCAESGYLASAICPKSSIRIPNKKQYVPVCDYHRLVHLDQSGRFRVNSSCGNPAEIRTEPWFVLPPLMGYYYQRSHPSYVMLPPFKSSCKQTGIPEMAFIYPKDGSRITLTKNFGGETGELVIKLAHAKPGTTVYWYLNDTYLGETVNYHERGLIPEKGRHRITAVDGSGNEIMVNITIE
ncbi:Penicillin-binding protein 1C [Arenibacter antarcticus]|uniref:peptidoglycan glycosyltransferase n=1 Tax=Arenibacter antarcticus TaxID=2040469 RepID=A0ABW5VLM9_9FLAO|nr:penicillin-binding protein 1C [Arenibacter sp. H213]MCM4166688.1 penicillin-binding protein 1C [Arenibacter sp. H213]